MSGPSWPHLLGDLSALLDSNAPLWGQGEGEEKEEEAQDKEEGQGKGMGEETTTCDKMGSEGNATNASDQMLPPDPVWE